MKALFLIFHGFSPSNGISKKIQYQVNALKTCGVETRLSYLEEPNGQKLRMIDSEVLQDHGNGIKGKILKRTQFKSIVDYVIKEKIQFVYIRSDHNANPFTICLVKNIRRANIKIVMEIPTYPYDQEYDSLKWKVRLLPDLCFRRFFVKYIDRIITFSNYDTIFGIPTIRISNGIDFSQIPLKKNIQDTSQALHLIAVAEIHYWHGFDRLIQGLALYYKTNPNYQVFFHLVGDFFGQREKNEILPLISRNHLDDYVILHGSKHGTELDVLFEKADLAIGSLARHRNGITYIKTLKNREYAARGLSFVYSEIDEDFEDKPYILKIPADESAIDINQVIQFYRKQSFPPYKIRESIQFLSWDVQMAKVITEIKRI